MCKKLRETAVVWDLIAPNSKVFENAAYWKHYQSEISSAMAQL